MKQRSPADHMSENCLSKRQEMETLRISGIIARIHQGSQSFVCWRDRCSRVFQSRDSFQKSFSLAVSHTQTNEHSEDVKESPYVAAIESGASNPMISSVARIQIEIQTALHPGHSSSPLVIFTTLKLTFICLIEALFSLKIKSIFRIFSRGERYTYTFLARKRNGNK